MLRQSSGSIIMIMTWMMMMITMMIMFIMMMMITVIMIFRDELGCDEDSCIKTNVLTDFGGQNLFLSFQII